MDLLASEAVARGFDRHPEVQTVLRNQLANLMQRRISERFKAAAPDEKDLKDYYDAHLENYVKPERVRARHIQLSDRAQAQKLLDELIAGKVSQYEFRSVAQERSEDPYTRTKGGDLTFFARPDKRQKNDPDIHEKIALAAFSIKENGAIHPALVETDKGFHIIMRTGHRKAMSISFTEAKERLVPLVSRRIQQERIDAEIDSLARKTSVTRYEENLKYVVIDLTSAEETAGESAVPGSSPLISSEL
jgi:parvulin-like peptidyl-prolyl isomerase